MPFIDFKTADTLIRTRQGRVVNSKRKGDGQVSRREFHLALEKFLGFEGRTVATVFNRMPSSFFSRGMEMRADMYVSDKTAALLKKECPQVKDCGSKEFTAIGKGDELKFKLEGFKDNETAEGIIVVDTKEVADYIFDRFKGDDEFLDANEYAELTKTA